MDLTKIVCNCFDVTGEDIKAAIDGGASSVEEVQDITNAGNGCGGCMELIENVVDELLAK